MSRRTLLRALLFVLAPLAALLGGLVAWGGPSGVPSAPVPSVPWTCPEPCDRFSIAWAGDTMVGDAAARKLRTKGWDSVLEHMPGMLEADYAVINAEAPFTRLGREHEPVPDRPWSYNVNPKVMDVLAARGVDAIGFSNNHTFDRGAQGLADTKQTAARAGVGFFGAGANRAEAEAPFLIETPHGTVGVVAFTYPRGQQATESQAGAIFMSRAAIQRGHRLAREAGARWVVAFTHWGKNYAPLGAWQKVRARQFAKAGYDLVVGHGPHIQQPVGRIGDTLILYSIGNFVFNSKGRFQKLDTPPWGLVARTWLGPEGFEAVELRCLQADNLVSKYKPRPCTEQERPKSYEALGGLAHTQGDAAWVRF